MMARMFLYLLSCMSLQAASGEQLVWTDDHNRTMTESGYSLIQTGLGHLSRQSSEMDPVHPLEYSGQSSEGGLGEEVNRSAADASVPAMAQESAESARRRRRRRRRRRGKKSGKKGSRRRRRRSKSRPSPSPAPPSSPTPARPPPANSKGSCAPLVLAGHDVKACANVPAGGSCEVKCPAGTEGDPVRFVCFQRNAQAKGPPVGLQSKPTCAKPGARLFSNGMKTALWLEPGRCLKCGGGGQKCAVIDAGTACTTFLMKGTPSGTFSAEAGRAGCADMFGGPAFGLWRCNGGVNQQFRGGGADGEICTISHRGKLCVRKPGGFGPPPVVPGVSLMRPALDSLKSGNRGGFLKRAMAVQMCKAKLEAPVPDSFWSWLERQDASAMKALFSTYPANSNQVGLVHEMRAVVGEAEFDKLKMMPFAVAVSFLNRFKKADDLAEHPHPNFEINNYNYLEKDLRKAKAAMQKGEHCNIQSNECRDLHKCCGKPEAWRFKWPRDAGPTVKQFAAWWVKSVKQHKDKLWHNPLRDTPWIFNLYLWPAPISECEWVREKVIGGQPIEQQGKWYKYDANFHRNICQKGNPKFHPDSLGGIAVYGGVCGRMAQLEWRKTGCMGLPATQKGEPGHCAGLKFIPQGESTTLTWPGRGCLVCKQRSRPCTTSKNQADCSKFAINNGKAKNELDVHKLLKEAETGQCLDLHGRNKPGLWGCNSGPNQKFKEEGLNNLVCRSPARGTLSLTTAKKSADKKAKASWAIDGIHEISCTQKSCHFNSATMNLDGSKKEVTKKAHKEAAKAMLESFNDYQQDGVWPVAHDEARLAASIAVALREQSSALAEAALGWALDRNPAVYEVWEAAGEHFAQLMRRRAAEREKLPSRIWYRKQKAGLLDMETSSESETAAMRFVQDRLLSGKHASFLERSPVLRQRLASQVCDWVPDTNGTVALQVGCSDQLEHPDALSKMQAAADGQDVDGNPPGEKFTQYLESLRTRLSKKDKTAIAHLRNLLDTSTVGYVNSRSETFFAQHGRVLLRGPYAQLLKLTPLVLEDKARRELLNKTREILVSPDEDTFASRIKAERSDLLERFSEFVPKHRDAVDKLKGKVSEEASQADDVSGLVPTDEAGTEIIEQLRLDRDAEAELAEDSWSSDFRQKHEGTDSRHDLDSLLPGLLGLSKPGDAGGVTQESPEDLADLAPSVEQTPSKFASLLHVDAQNALSDCVEEMEQRFTAKFWSR